MPKASKKFCTTHPNIKVDKDNPCPRCKKTNRVRLNKYEKNRPSSRERGYTRAWDRYRIEFKAEHPTCQYYCKLNGIVTPMQEIDHIIDHEQDQELFWNEQNHAAACKSCHSRKTIMSMNIGLAKTLRKLPWLVDQVRGIDHSKVKIVINQHDNLEQSERVTGMGC